MSYGEEAARSACNAFRAIYIAGLRRTHEEELERLSTEYENNKARLIAEYDVAVTTFHNVFNANPQGYTSQILAAHAARPRSQPTQHLDGATDENTVSHMRPAAVSSHKKPPNQPRARMGNFGPPQPLGEQPVPTPMPQNAGPPIKPVEPTLPPPPPAPDATTRPKRTVKLTEKSTLRPTAPEPLKRARSASPEVAAEEVVAAAPSQAPSEDNPDLDFCREMLRQLDDNAHAATFQDPVDRKQYPDYYRRIKHPMHLGKIRNNLEHGVYKTSEDFKADFNLMISNCTTYNPVGDPFRERAIDFQRFFQHLWNGKERWERSSKRRKTAEGDD